MGRHSGVGGSRGHGLMMVLLLGGSVWVAMACEGKEESAAFERRDSAGIEIVESYRPLWDQGEEWRVGSQPSLRVGVLEGDAAFQFDGVTGGIRLADGTLAVADYGYQEIRFFDRDGRHLSTFGGQGEGPGEFQGLAGLGLDPEGRIWAFDFLLRRITWLNGRGEMEDLTRLGSEPPMLQPVGPLNDGTFLFKQLWGASQVAEATEPGLRRDDIAFVRFDGSGELVDTLGLFPGREVFLTEEDGRGVMSTPPFPRNTMGAVWNGMIITGDNDAFQLEQRTPSGEVRRIFRLPDVDLTLDSQEREEYIQGRLEAVAEELRPGLRNSLESMAFPGTRPAFGGIIPDQAGNLWIGDWALTPQVAAYFTVLDSVGRWLGNVDVPPGFSPLHIGEDWILGVQWDEVDVEHLVLFPLVKGEPHG